MNNHTPWLKELSHGARRPPEGGQMGRKPCVIAGCRHLALKDARHSRCEIHAPLAWAGSKRRQAAAGVPQGQDWMRLRKQVLYRDGYRCVHCGEAGNEIDHIVPVSAGGHPMDSANLQTLCTPCHARVTAEQREEYGWND